MTIRIAMDFPPLSPEQAAEHVRRLKAGERPAPLAVELALCLDGPDAGRRLTDAQLAVALLASYVLARDPDYFAAREAAMHTAMQPDVHRLTARIPAGGPMPTTTEIAEAEHADERRRADTLDAARRAAFAAARLPVPLLVPMVLPKIRARQPRATRARRRGSRRVATAGTRAGPGDPDPPGAEGAGPHDHAEPGGPVA